MSAALRRLWSLERRRRERALGVSHGTPLPELPDDDFQARFAFYLLVAEHVKDRRVLELGCRSGFGTPAVVHRDAHAVVALEEEPGAVRLAERRNQSEKVVHVQSGGPPNRRGLPEVGLFESALGFVDSWSAWHEDPSSTLDWLCRRLPRGQVYLAIPHEGRSPGTTEWLELLDSRFHYRRLLRHLAPCDYRPRWGDSTPARARAQEHRFVPLEDPLEPPPEDSLYDVVVAAAPRATFRNHELKLHLGSGPERLTGWVNIDNQCLPSVDVVADVTDGLPFRDAGAVFAEHFLEHLDLEAAIELLLAVHGALRERGLLRLVTPNLDWVIATQHRAQGAATELARAALSLNRGFSGWGHRFVWNHQLLATVLAACGFDELRWPERGASDHPELRGLERHETYEDRPELPHVIVVEARRGPAAPKRMAALRELLDSEWEPGQHAHHDQ